MTQVAIRPLDPAADAEIALVATRMRATLMEVLGAERGEAMYTLDWLRDRVRFHLDPQRCDGAVYVAVLDGEIVGHTIVRVEEEDGAAIGLFSTTYVTPEARRAGVAAALLARGEDWMRERGLGEAATYTDPRNERLISLYATHGYGLARANEEFVRLSRSLDA